MPDMLFIMLLAVLLFGPKKLPEVARQIARFKNARDNLKAQLETEFSKLEVEARDIMPSGAQDLRSAFEPLTKLREHFDNVISSSMRPRTNRRNCRLPSARKAGSADATRDHITARLSPAQATHSATTNRQNPESLSPGLL